MSINFRRDVQIIKLLFHTFVPLLLVMTLVVGLNQPTIAYKQEQIAVQELAPRDTVAALDSEQKPNNEEQNLTAAASDAGQKPETTATVKTASSSPPQRATTTLTPSRSQPEAKTSNDTTKTNTNTSKATNTSANNGTNSGTVSSDTTALKATSSSKATAIITTAKQYIGVKYQWGGTTPSGFDCSGYTKYVYAQNGVSLPRISRDQFNAGQAVAFDNLQPADLVFFSMDGDKITDHVGIYMGSGQFIHASSSKGVTISTMTSYWKSKYLGARRVL